MHVDEFKQKQQAIINKAKGDQLATVNESLDFILNRIASADGNFGSTKVKLGDHGVANRLCLLNKKVVKALNVKLFHYGWKLDGVDGRTYEFCVRPLKPLEKLWDKLWNL
jgi:hypothetical protein